LLTSEEKERLDHLIGKPLEEIDTPALVVDVHIMEENMDKMMEFLRQGTVGIRPHAKTHKTPPIARMQMERGAVGITCAKLGEAEVLADGGIRDILIANQIVGESKLKRAAILAGKTDLKVAVDSTQNVKDLSKVAAEAKNTIGIVVEVEVGNNRSGVRDAEEAIAIADLASKLPFLRYRGIMAYEGHAVFIKELEKRKKVAEESYARLLRVRDALAEAGYPPQIVSSGGTGTYLLAGRTEGITDIQAGSYIFMDTRYAGVQGVGFKQSLTVLSTIVSHPEKGLYICDAGIKSMSEEFGPVSPLPSYGLKVVGMSEEHVRLAPAEADPAHISHSCIDLDRKYAQGILRPLRSGSKIHLIPSHCCTTVNLHDLIYAVRNGVVENVWRVAGRGRFA